MIPGILVASLLALSAGGKEMAPRHDAPDGWWTIRSVRYGQLIHHFVLVEGPSAALRETYEDAAASLCRNETHCQIHFWDDPDNAVSDIPLDDAQLNTRTAHYVLNTQTGYSRLVVACHIDNDPHNCSRAFRR